MDPLADKLLVCSAMICLVQMGRIPAWIVIIIISREFIISGFRLVASDKGVVIAASWWGKFKTTFQMVMIILMIADIAALSVVTQIVMWIALILTVGIADRLSDEKQRRDEGSRLELTTGIRGETAMTVELICVGTELLLGNIVNTNAAWLAEQCAALGLSCYYQTVVGDNAQRLVGILRTGLERSDILILSGGLGPTQDDLTKETAAQVCGRKLTEDARSLSRIEEYFRERGLKMTDNNRKQALVPEGALVVDNDNGTAPGLIWKRTESGSSCFPVRRTSSSPCLKKRSLPIFFPWIRTALPSFIPGP